MSRVVSRDEWQWTEVDPGNDLWRKWILTKDHMIATFVTCKDRRNSKIPRYVSVTFSRDVTKLTPARGAKAYATAEACRFMAQMHDTVGDLSRGEEALGLEVRFLQDSSQSECAVSLEGDDAVGTGAIYFGIPFADAIAPRC